MNPAMERTLKKYSNDMMNWLCRLRKVPEKGGKVANKASVEEINPGDWVRVKSLEEIMETTNHWAQVKGCAFMPVMEKYCNTIHKVHRRMNRFVDERDLKIKKSNGIILLENVLCEGTHENERCDRACLHFWRQEWLEKIPDPKQSAEHSVEYLGTSQRWVRVKSISEIQAGLRTGDGLGRRLFVPEMEKYCGTKQRALKTMTRYMDEYDLRFKKTSGIILLDGVMCEGRSDISGCDRSCLYMWKNDWLVDI